MKTTTKNVREVIVDILMQIEKNQSYSNLLINQAIKHNHVPIKDVPLLTEIVYGSIQRKITLDYYITPFLKNPKKIEDWVIVLLRMTVYQMYYLTRVPDRAAIFEAVEIAKKRGHKGIASMVNGVLRSIQREGKQSLEKINNPIKRLSLETSFPEWMVNRWVNQFGMEETRQMCEASLSPPNASARVNQTQITIHNLLNKLEEEGIHATEGDLSIDAIKLEKGNVANTLAFKEGLLTVQDESSMLVARALGIQENDKILDCCGAPGGKTTHMAEILSDTGVVVSVDLHAHKVKLIEEQVSRLKLSNVETLVMDSRKLSERFQNGHFDRILVDAPCSGLGVIRRKPDIKYQKREEDIDHLANIQLTILSSVAPLLKKGGTLVYSTCTMDKEENDGVVTKFLEKFIDFELDTELMNRLPEKIRLKSICKDGQVQILPHHFNTDGFFISCFRKRV
ncbi:16S rRNA (cytosine(967)-C(5))-methyltransferase RsmB [Bacillus salitolerans]|uniref:16S rRNA (cytosine(967)-C(5))-methyltransferase n=1 Tax=Bacillus salitolerans TaxID=1437434 RepID=A0ABW4LKX9_9BACI